MIYLETNSLNFANIDFAEMNIIDNNMHLLLVNFNFIAGKMKSIRKYQYHIVTHMRKTYIKKYMICYFNVQSSFSSVKVGVNKSSSLTSCKKFSVTGVVFFSL